MCVSHIYKCIILFCQVREYSFGTSLPVVTSASIGRIQCTEEDENDPVVCYSLSPCTLHHVANTVHRFETMKGEVGMCVYLLIGPKILCTQLSILKLIAGTFCQWGLCSEGFLRRVLYVLKPTLRVSSSLLPQSFSPLFLPSLSPLPSFLSHNIHLLPFPSPLPSLLPPSLPPLFPSLLTLPSLCILSPFHSTLSLPSLPLSPLPPSRFIKHLICFA